MPSFSYLSQTVITDIKQAFSNAQMPYDDDLRGLLLSGINFQYANSLKKELSNQRQLTGDLNSLNVVERLDDGSVPLREWLTNAREQFESRTEANIFRQALEHIARGEKSTPQKPADTDKIVEGLEALSALVRKSQSAYEAFVIYGNAFQTALDDIDVIADYKLLHEELHGLQLAWPDDIAATLKNLAEDPKAQMELRKDSESLKGIINRQRAIFRKGSVDRDESKWIENVDQTQKELDMALRAVAKVKIEMTFDTIRSLVSVQLFALNTRLKRAIEQLHLKALIAVMKKLCDALKDIAGGRFSKHIQQYESGLVQLEVLDGEIAKLIIQHDDWNLAISRLQMLSEQIEGASKEEDPSTVAVVKRSTLKTALETIDKKIEPLHKGSTAGWAADLIKSAEELRNAVNEGKVDKAESWFLTYRDQAGHFFFDLDTEMKNQSEELRRIGDQLRIVNKELD